MSSKTPGKKKQKPGKDPEPVLNSQPVRPPEVCQKCGRPRREPPSFHIAEELERFTGEGKTYYVCLCGAVCAWR